MAVYHVSVKLPDFWEEDPATWFIETEAQFALAGITVDQTKYHHVVTKLTKRSTTDHVWDILANPPAQGKYEAIKTRLISVFSDSTQEKFDKIMNAELGDQKPSHLLAYMRRLAQQMNMSDDQLKMIYLKKLPPSASVLSIISSPLSEIGVMADTVVKQEPQVNQLDKSSDSKYDELKGEIENLTAAIRKMGQEQKSKPPRKDNRHDAPTDICWYHREHGRNARKCRPPCKFSKN